MSIASISKGACVLVTGATGFTGSVLTRKLVVAGARVKAIARHSSDLSHLDDLDVEWFRGDVFDPETVSAAMKDVEYVFHLATAYRQGGTDGEYFQKIHVESTMLLAQTALDNSDFKRFVHISTIGVHGHIEGKPADENHPFAPGDDYQRTKAEAELWIRDFASKKKLSLTVIRPTGIYGPGDKRLFKLFKMASKKYLPILGRGKCMYHLIHVDDLTNVMILAATHPKALGEVFICGNEEPITLIAIANIIADTLNNKLTVVRLPAWPFFIIGAICEILCRPFGIQPPIYRRRVAFFTKDRMFNTEKLRKVLGYTSKHSNRNGLAQTTQWYKKKGWLK